MKKSIILLLLGLLLISSLSAICYGDSCPGDTDCDRAVDGSDLANVVKDHGNSNCPECIAAPVPKTGLTTTVYPGDDGALQKGVEWPDPRFTDNEDGTITDHLTGLIWLKDVRNCFYRDTWSDAVNICSTLADGQCGLTDGSVPGDWRLPNVRELFSMVNISGNSPFLGDAVYIANYWSSTKLASRHPYKVWGWIVNIGSGWTYHNTMGTYNYIWPVRGGND